MQDPMMTIEDMYQEMVEQEVADIFLDNDSLIIEDLSMDAINFDIDYTTQS